MSLAAYVLRMAAYWVVEDPVLALLPELLHGLTFAAGWAAATRYMHDLAGAAPTCSFFP